MSYVLVVDDQPTVRDLLRRYLEEWGFGVEDAADATEALKGMKAKPAAIAIVDIRMPGQTGLWLAEQIHQRWRSTGIIIVSADSEAARLHAYDHIVKPIDRDELRETVLRVAQRVHLIPNRPDTE